MASGFLTTYLGIPIFLVIWLGHKFTVGRHDPWMYKPETVDLASDVREVEADAELWTGMEMVEKEHGGVDNKWWSKISVIWG